MINNYGYVYGMTVAVCVFCIIRVVASSLDVARAIRVKYAMLVATVVVPVATLVVLVVTVELARPTDVFELTVGAAGARGAPLDGRALLGRARSLIHPCISVGLVAV